MKKSHKPLKQTISHPRRRIFVALGWFFGVLLGVVLLLVGLVYAWPLTDGRLQAQPYQDYTFEQAVKEIETRVTADEQDGRVKADCGTKAYLHETRQARSVVLFHGYTACTEQYDSYARDLYEAGYNVYVPRAPKHGLGDGGRIIAPAAELASYASEAVSFAKALGEESGAIGISGGGVLATWTAAYRPDAVKRTLILSPFYEPAPELAPKWQIKPLVTLVGQFGLFDINDGDDGTYRGLSQYLLLVRNLPTGQSQPLPAAVIVAPGDPLIDKQIASNLSQRLLPARQLFETPAQWNFTHDIMSADEIGEFGSQAYSEYTKAYESSNPELLIRRP